MKSYWLIMAKFFQFLLILSNNKKSLTTTTKPCRQFVFHFLSMFFSFWITKNIYIFFFSWIIFLISHIAPPRHPILFSFFVHFFSFWTKQKFQNFRIKFSKSHTAHHLTQFFCFEFFLFFEKLAKDADFSLFFTKT